MGMVSQLLFPLVVFLVLLLALSVSGQRVCNVPGSRATPIRFTADCPPGFYCPNIVEGNFSTYAQVCPPAPQCQLDRLAGKFCNAQGLYEPTVCRQGYYCPEWTSELICPEGHFCPLGSTAPTPCNIFAFCPEGSRTQIFYGGLLIIVIVDIVMMVVLGILWRIDKKASEAIPVIDEEKQKLIHGRTEDLAAGFERGCFGKRLDLQFEDLSYKLPTGKIILSGVTGHIQPGRVVAVMGPSGAGKTTFLSVMMGKVARSGGSLFINGKESEMSKFKKVIGYVPQEDIMLRELTVRENITYSARIRLPRWSKKDVDNHIDAVINSLGLDHVQNVLIGDETTRGISGGQRKRVNIGLELAACPIALFLDEPTSGLDSTAALSVCQTLKNIAGLGMTVVAVIHQPRYEIFESFDDILLLAPGGKTAYIGPQRGILPYFESLGFEFPAKLNPADVLMDVVAGKVLPTKHNITNIDLVSRWESNAMELVASNDYGIHKGSINDFISAEERGEFYKKGQSLRDRITSFKQDNSITSDSLETIASKRGADFFKQILLSHNRSILQQYRKMFSYGLEVMVGTLAGLMMGAATIAVESSVYQGVLAGLFVFISPSPNEVLLPQLGLLISMAIGIAGAPAGVLTFGEEKVVYWREAACGHSKLAYYIGKTLSTIFRFTMSSFHFAASFYLLCRPLTPFGEFYLFVFQTFCCVYGLSAAVSMIVPRENAPLLAVISALIFATLCGYGPTLTLAEEFKVKWLFALSYNRWGVEAFYDTETRPFRDLMRVEEVSAPFFGYTLNRFGFDMGIMALFTVMLRVLAFVLLIMVQRRKQQ